MIRSLMLAGAAAVMLSAPVLAQSTTTQPVPGTTTARDGTPGNPPGTEASRALDRAAGTNNSGAYPGQTDGTRANPPGTVASRTLEQGAAPSGPPATGIGTQNRGN